MAKLPLPGRAKTRLAPVLGDAGAARLCAAMTGDVLDTVRASGLPFRVAVDGDVDHPWVRSLQADVEPQRGADLGARLAHALRDGGVAVGTDAPTLPLAFLQEAAASTADVVLAPAFDGGYVLVGAAAVAGLFEGVPWSAPDTFARQVERARALGLTIRVLPFWYDVDGPEDLAFLRHHLATLPPSVAPRTRNLLDAAPPG